MCPTRSAFGSAVLVWGPAFWAIGACASAPVPDAPAGQDPPQAGGQPLIQVGALEVDFGDLDNLWQGDPTQLTRTAEVWVENTGTADLELTDLDIEPLELGFAVAPLVQSLVQPGAGLSLELSFAPQPVGHRSALLRIHSNDPVSPEIEVALRGAGVGPILATDPAALDHGEVWVGCTDRIEWTVSNAGNWPLQITGLETQAEVGGFVLETHTDLPWTLEAGEAETLWADHTPLAAGTHTAVALLLSDAVNGPELGVPWQATALETGRGAIEITVPLEDQVDMLVSVDRTAIEEAYEFPERAKALPGLFADRGLHLQLGITVEDDGCINGDTLFVDEAAAAEEARATMLGMINLGGSYGSNPERAFMLMDAALAEAAPGGCNEGLIREGASLHLVSLTDEGEQSGQAYTAFLPGFQALKDDPDQVVMHAIAGDHPSGCGTADPPGAYYDAILATGGLLLSICATDWTTHFDQLADAAGVELSTHPLPDIPVIETINVTIDGVGLTEGWTYQAVNNTVVLDHQALPLPGSTLRIDYVIDTQDCD